MTMNTKKQFQLLQANMKRERLRELCREHGFSFNSLLRVAHHKVYDEDVLQECPDFDSMDIQTRYQQALQLAKDALRLEYKANADDPDSRYRAGWWECPSEQEELEQVRREYRERKESGLSPADELFAALGWKPESAKRERREAGAHSRED